MTRASIDGSASERGNSSGGIGVGSTDDSPFASTVVYFARAMTTAGCRDGSGLDGLLRNEAVQDGTSFLSDFNAMPAKAASRLLFQIDMCLFKSRAPRP